MHTDSDQESFPSSPGQVMLLLIKQGKPFISSHSLRMLKLRHPRKKTTLKKAEPVVKSGASII